MIIDGDTHMALSNDARFSLENHLKAMDRAGIDKALVWLSPHHYVGTGIAAQNEHLYKAAKAHPDRLLPFGWTDPHNGVEHAIEMVRLCTEEYGFYGVKMNGAQNNYFIDDEELALPVVEAIARSGKMIAFHIGPDAYERTHPWRAMRIAKMYPEMPMLMVHMGMTDRDMNRAVVEAARECSSMVLVASATTDSAALLAIQQLGAERVCFGSDWPFRKTHVIKGMFESSFEDELSEEAMAAFMGGNLAGLFGL
jgi:predicted TIM-barrel fold metal-dependent hydrolase